MASEFEDLQTQIEAAVQHVDKFEAHAAESAGAGGAFAVQPATLEPEMATVVARGLRASLMIAEASMGECQEEMPYSPMRPVKKPGATKVVWCCNHEPQHCSGCC